MFSGLEIGRIAGIPIFLDMFFVLLLLFFSYPYFTTGNTQDMSAGFVIIVTGTPASASASAVVQPAMPEPMIRTSLSKYSVIDQPIASIRSTDLAARTRISSGTSTS